MNENENKNTKLIKAALEYVPLAAFFLTYLFYKDDTLLIFGREMGGFVLATLVLVPLIIIATILGWVLLGEVSRMQLVTLVLLVVFGGMTVFFNDERFLKMKPTLIYALFFAVLMFGLWRKQSYLQFMLGQALPLEREGWMILTRRMAIFFLGLAILNELVWRTQSTETWVYFKTFGLSAAMFVFFITQIKVFKDYGQDND